jgi:hypothetical protein
MEYLCVAGKAVLGVPAVLLDQWWKSTAEDAEDAEEQRGCERATHYDPTTG